MAKRRRALRDHGDPGPLVALVRATLREAAEARQRAREGLAAHLRGDAELRILPRFDPPDSLDDAESA